MMIENHEDIMVAAASHLFGGAIGIGCLAVLIGKSLYLSLRLNKVLMH